MGRCRGIRGGGYRRPSRKGSPPPTKRRSSSTPELLPKDHKEAWTHDRRKELRRLYLTLLLDLATLYEGREEYERGIGMLRRALRRSIQGSDARRPDAPARRRRATLQYELLVEPVREPGPETRRL